MKKLVYLLLPMFLFFACNNANNTKTENTDQQEQEVKCEKSACCEAWKNWDDQDEAKKAELVQSFIEKMNVKIEKCLAKEDVENPEEHVAKIEALKAKLAEIEAAEDLELQKSLIDEIKANCCKKDGEKKCNEEKE